MKKSFEIYDGDYVAEYEETPEKMKACWDKILRFCEKYEVYSGEGGCQNDNFNCFSPDLLAEIIDEIIKFDLIEK